MDGINPMPYVRDPVISSLHDNILSGSGRPKLPTRHSELPVSHPAIKQFIFYCVSLGNTGASIESVSIVQLQSASLASPGLAWPRLASPDLA